MNALSRIERGAAARPPRLMVYGVEGIGKTQFASRAPKPIFIQTEDGLDAIDCDRFPLANSFADVTQALHVQVDPYERRQRQHRDAS